MKIVTTIIALTTYLPLYTMESNAGIKPPAQITQRDQKERAKQALEKAIMAGDEKTVRTMLKQPVSPDARLSDELTPLSFALVHKKKNVAEDLTYKLRSQRLSIENAFLEPFRLAAQSNTISLINDAMLLDIPIELKKRGCVLALCEALHKEESYSFIKQLIFGHGKYIEHPFTVCNFHRDIKSTTDRRYKERYQPIMETLFTHPHAIEDLKQLSSTIPGPDGQLYKELLELTQQIASSHLFEVIKNEPDDSYGKIHQAIERGAHIHAKNENGFTPLQAAALWGKCKMFICLHDSGALLSNNLLINAVIGEHFNMIALLLDRYKFNINLPSEGITPLHAAIKTRKTALVYYLLTRGAIIQPDYYGISNQIDTMLQTFKK